MKHLFLIILFFFVSGLSVNAQENVNLKNGFAAEGYDVVAYFQDTPAKGNSKYRATHDGVAYKFVNAENLVTFEQNPTAYLPQYGGFCAYAIASSGKKVGVNPKTFLISDGKLYLFYNSWGVNTLEKWKEEGTAQLQQKANARWKFLIDPQ